MIIMPGISQFSVSSSGIIIFAYLYCQNAEEKAKLKKKFVIATTRKATADHVHIEL